MFVTQRTRSKNYIHHREQYNSTESDLEQLDPHFDSALAHRAQRKRTALRIDSIHHLLLPFFITVGVLALLFLLGVSLQTRSATLGHQTLSKPLNRTDSKNVSNSDTTDTHPTVASRTRSTRSRQNRKQRFGAIPPVERSVFSKLLRLGFLSEEEHAEARSPKNDYVDPDFFKDIPWPPLITALPKSHGTTTSRASARNANTKSKTILQTELAAFDRNFCGTHPCRLLLPTWVQSPHSAEIKTETEYNRRNARPTNIIHLNRKNLENILFVAARLNRTLVLPNVAEGRFGSCFKHKLASYYDVRDLLRRRPLVPLASDSRTGFSDLNGPNYDMSTKGRRYLDHFSVDSEDLEGGADGVEIESSFRTRALAVTMDGFTEWVKSRPVRPLGRIVTVAVHAPRGISTRIIPNKTEISRTSRPDSEQVHLTEPLSSTTSSTPPLHTSSSDFAAPTVLVNVTYDHRSSSRNKGEHKNCLSTRASKLNFGKWAPLKVDFSLSSNSSAGVDNLESVSGLVHTFDGDLVSTLNRLLMTADPEENEGDSSLDILCSSNPLSETSKEDNESLTQGCPQIKENHTASPNSKSSTESELIADVLALEWDVTPSDDDDDDAFSFLQPKSTSEKIAFSVGYSPRLKKFSMDLVKELKDYFNVTSFTVLVGATGAKTMSCSARSDDDVSFSQDELDVGSLKNDTIYWMANGILDPSSSTRVTTNSSTNSSEENNAPISISIDNANSTTLNLNTGIPTTSTGTGTVDTALAERQELRDSDDDDEAERKRDTSSVSPVHRMILSFESLFFGMGMDARRETESHLQLEEPHVNSTISPPPQHLNPPNPPNATTRTRTTPPHTHKTLLKQTTKHLKSLGLKPEVLQDVYGTGILEELVVSMADSVGFVSGSGLCSGLGVSSGLGAGSD